METTLRHKLLAYLAGVAIAMGSGSVGDAQADLEAIPEPVLMELLDETLEESWRSEDRVSLTELLLEDRRRSMRRRSAELLGQLGEIRLWDRIEPVLRRLAQDGDRTVRIATAEAMASWLFRLDGLTGTRVITEWTLSEAARERWVVAKALSAGQHLLGADLVVEFLGGDVDSGVRLAVVEASENRFQENNVLYSAVLEKLTRDPHRYVRRAARRATARLRR